MSLLHPISVSLSHRVVANFRLLADQVEDVRLQLEDLEGTFAQLVPL